MEKVGSEKECQEDIPRKTSHPSTTTPEHQEEIGEGQDDIPDSSMAAGILRQEDGLARDDPWSTAHGMGESQINHFSNESMFGRTPGARDMNDRKMQEARCEMKDSVSGILSDGFPGLTSSRTGAEMNTILERKDEQTETSVGKTDKLSLLHLNESNVAAPPPPLSFILSRSV